MPRRTNSETRGYAAPKPTVDEILALWAQVNRARSDFLKIDVETGLTFTCIARESYDPINRQRNVRAARRAYDTVLVLMDRVTMSENNSLILRQNLRRLRSELLEVGEVIENGPIPEAESFGF